MTSSLSKSPPTRPSHHVCHVSALRGRRAHQAGTVAADISLRGWHAGERNLRKVCRSRSREEQGKPQPNYFRSSRILHYLVARNTTSVTSDATRLAARARPLLPSWARQRPSSSTLEVAQRSSSITFLAGGANDVCLPMLRCNYCSEYSNRFGTKRHVLPNRFRGLLFQTWMSSAGWARTVAVSGLGEAPPPEGSLHLGTSSLCGDRRDGRH